MMDLFSQSLSGRDRRLKMKFSFWDGLFSGPMLVSGRVCQATPVLTG